MVIPSSVAALLAFLLLVAPGLWAELLYSRRLTGRSDYSSFREIGRVALFSLTCSSLGSLAIGTALNLSRHRTGFDALRAVKDTDYASDHFWWSVTAVAAISLTGCVIATLIYLLRFGSFRSVVQIASAWTVEFSATRDEPEGTRTDVMVELLTGERYVGVLAGFTPNLEQSNRELTLAQPMWLRRSLDGDLAAIPEEYERLVLRGDQIKTVAVRKWIPSSIRAE